MTNQSLKQNENVLHAPAQARITTDEIITMIAGWMKGRNRAMPSDPDMSFADAGLDSLDSLELAFFLQDQLGVEIDDTVLYNYPTFSALARYVTERL